MQDGLTLRPPGTAEGGAWLCLCALAGAEERQGKGARPQPFTPLLPQSLQQSFFQHFLLGAEDSQPKDSLRWELYGEDSEINKHLSPDPAHVRGADSRGPSQLASRDPAFCLDRDREGDLTRPVNPGTNTVPRRCP